MFAFLQQCVRPPASEKEFEAIRAAVDEWYEFVSRNILHGRYQGEVARTLVEVARRAAKEEQDKEPDSSATTDQQRVEAQQIQRICLGGLGAWEWDAFCALLSAPRRSLPNASISVLLEQGGIGCLARLEVELIADGAGDIYRDPQSNGFIEFDQSFLGATVAVWKAVKREATPKLEEREKLEKVDARFRLLRIQVPEYRNPRLEALSGRSAQAAFHLCLLQAARAYLGEPDVLLLDSVAVSATVEDGGRLGGVGALESKLEAAYLKGLALVVVAKEDETKARQALEAAKTRRREKESASAVEVVGAETIADAERLLRERAKEKEAVLRHEHDQCSQLEILDRCAPIETHYQVLPLLLEVKRERLPKAMKGRMGEWENGGEEEERGGLRGIDLVRWEEELREERIAYEPHSLEEVFANFRRVAKDAKSDVPRFFVLGPPGSGKTTLAQYLAWACSGSRGESSNALGIGQLRFASGMTANLIPARVRLREWEAWATKPENPEHGLPQSCPI